MILLWQVEPLDLKACKAMVAEAVAEVLLNNFFFPLQMGQTHLALVEAWADLALKIPLQMQEGANLAENLPPLALMVQTVAQVVLAQEVAEMEELEAAVGF